MKLKFQPDVQLHEIAAIIEALHEEDPLTKGSREGLPEHCRRHFVAEVETVEPKKETTRKRRKSS